MVCGRSSTHPSSTRSSRFGPGTPSRRRAARRWRRGCSGGRRRDRPPRHQAGASSRAHPVAPTASARARRSRPVVRIPAGSSWIVERLRRAQPAPSTATGCCVSPVLRRKDDPPGRSISCKGGARSCVSRRRSRAPNSTIGAVGQVINRSVRRQDPVKSSVPGSRRPQTWVAVARPARSGPRLPRRVPAPGLARGLWMPRR